MSIKNVTAAAQRDRLVGYMREHGEVNTLQARCKLNIMAPAPRVMELKELSYCIGRELRTATDEYGDTHPRVAHYWIISEPKVVA